MIDAILDQCLDSMFERQATIAECLQRYPEYAKDLEPLLQMAVALQTVQDVQPSSGFKSSLRARLVEEPDRGGAVDKEPDLQAGPPQAIPSNK